MVIKDQMIAGEQKIHIKRCICIFLFLFTLKFRVSYYIIILNRLGGCYMGFFSKAKDPVSSCTHYIGAIFSLIFTVIIIIKGITTNASLDLIVGSVIFGLSAIALYSSSSIYHFFNQSDVHPTKIKLRKLDHAMIYVLIVGSYTPVIVRYVQQPKNYIFLIILWCIAFIGIIAKLFWLNAPRWLSTVFYLVLGWSIVFDVKAFYGMNTNCLLLIAMGGLSYTVGALVYILKKPNWFKQFDFHDLFHIFVMIGTLFHFIAVIIYVV